MSQHRRGADSHPDEPPEKRRTLQIKLGRPRPQTDLQQPEQASPSLNRAIRISLKRKPSIPESHATRPRFAAAVAYQDDEGDNNDKGDDDEEQQVNTGATSDQEDEHDEDGHDDQEDEEDEGKDGEEGDEDDADGDRDGTDGKQDVGTGEGDGGLDNNATDANGGATSPRVRGKNGAFRRTSGSSSNPSRRPIKRLRSKGLYEALPKLIENLQRRDSYKFFCEPVKPDNVPGYTDVIKTPMDFGTMQRKVDDRLYSHMDEFRVDFQLVILNAQTFNPEGTLYYNEAKRIGTWGNRAIEREGMAVNDNGRAGVKGDEIRRQKRLARDAVASSSAAVMSPDTPAGETSGRRQLRVSTLQQQQALDDGSQMIHVSTPSGIDGVSGDLYTRSAARGSHFAFSAGVEAIMEAARVPSHARQRAAVALGLVGGTLTREDSVQPGYGVKGEGDVEMDLDDEDDMDVSDEEGGRASVARGRESRERSVTVDGPAGSISRRFGSSQPGGTPSTPMGQRQPSPDALRKRLAAVRGTPIQALASPIGPNATAGGTSRASKHAKGKQRLGAPGTPKRLLARTGNIGPATPLSGIGASTGAVTDPAAAAAAAAAQVMANVSQTHLQPGIANYSFDDDGSINPEDIDDLQTFLTLHHSDRHVLMPTIESLHPIPFIPSDYAGSGVGDKDKDQDKDKDKYGKEKDKEKAKDKGAGADDGDDDDEDGKGEGREKGDKDPLSTLPPARPGAPDPLYSAIAPEPEPFQCNFSHDVDALPPHFRNLPFYTPSLRAEINMAKPTETQKDRQAEVPCSWSNPAYIEALKNDKRPKKQKDKERERERETLEDWSYFRPILTRLLEITDLGPYSALVPTAKINARDAGITKSKAAEQIEAPSGTGLATTLLAEDGIEAIKVELKRKRQGLTLPEQLLDRYIQAARNGDAKAGKELLTVEQRQDASRILSDMVYAGVVGNAYIRSVGEFVGGAMHHAMLLDGADDEEEHQAAAAERQLLIAAVLGQAREEIDIPEPTAASRRGPFMWRDTTEEPGGGTGTPLVAPNDGDQDQQQGRASTAHTTAIGTPAVAGIEEVKPAISGLLEELDVVEKQLAPLPKPLAQMVEEEIIRPITGNTLDVLHLVAVYLKTQGSEALDVEEVEARLLKEQATRHKVEGLDPSLLADNTGKKSEVAATMTPPPPAAAAAAAAQSQSQSQSQSQPQPQVDIPLPFTAETEWLKDQPELTRLLDEARQDVDSLGSIVNYIIQSA
ncbi:hypothetical protein NDA14_001436 [Ustilago hordei]|nr:hypothetical protein NDA14_001436 [Ustilago hordei]